MNPENWHWPHYVIATIAMIRLFVAAHFHGKPQTGKQDFFASLIVTAFFTCYVLYSGGFWK
jgi:hypothetical protein